MENMAESMAQNLHKLALISLSITLFLFATVFWLLRSSIRAAIHSGRFFIRSMELLGASPWFIRRPYVLSVGLGGAIGGIAASVLLGIGIQILIRFFPEASPYFPDEMILWICLGIIPAGFLLSFFPALGAIKAYQQRKLSDLHR
jgi:cell division transport system permease protein